MAESTIITGQFVRISQTPASIGERLMALIIDYFLIGLYAGCSLVWMPAAFGITAVLSSLAAAVGLYITSCVLLMVADIADAVVAQSERDIR